MSKQVQDAYIVAATRTPIGRSGRGYFRNTRPDELLVAAIRSAMLQVPTLDPKAIEDAIIGCSFPEGEQGMNMARIATGLAFANPVGGVTVNWLSVYDRLVWKPKPSSALVSVSNGIDRVASTPKM